MMFTYGFEALYTRVSRAVHSSAAPHPLRNRVPLSRYSGTKMKFWYSRAEAVFKDILLIPTHFLSHEKADSFQIVLTSG
jgi:hypothetical protein